MTEARRSMRAAAGVLMLQVASSTLLQAQLKSPAVPNPDPAVQSALTLEAPAIKRLLDTATNRGAPAPDRVKAIHGLGGLYFDHFLANAEALISDPDAEVAQASVVQLGGQIAMLHASHGGGHGGPGTEGAAGYTSHVVSESIRLLRLAMDHPDPAVRNEAAGVLTSRGDLQALARVQARIEAGQMSVPEGVRYMSLAPLDVAAPYIAVYLTSPDAAARRAAVVPLSYHPGYTIAVRSLVIGPNSDETVVRAALPGLSVTDKDYATYGSAIVQNKTLSRETREIALESAVRFALKSNTPTAEARDLATALSTAAEELQSDRARAAVRDLKAKHQME